MPIVVNLVFWLHFVGIALGFGGGVALSQIGPRLIAAPADQRGQWWPLQILFSRIAVAGLVTMLITGPILVWLKFGGVGDFNRWFWAKMALVALATFSIGVNEWAAHRLKRDEQSAGRLMLVSGRVTGVSMVLVMLCAVFAFN